MKKLLCLLLVLIISLSLWACGSVSEDDVLGFVDAVADLATAYTEEIDAAEPSSVLSEATEPLLDFTTSTTAVEETPPMTQETAPLTEDLPQLDEDGTYSSKEDVALYIFTFGHLPGNYITKKEAQSLGWPGGSLEPYAPGKCIGGSRFGNYEGLLPEAAGRTYTECDIDTLGASSRGAKRIVFSNDGLIYYTGDHYQTFELLYGEE